MMKQKILVVDDESDILDILVLLLGDLGYDVEGYRNPLEALPVADRFPIIILDWMMPEMSGIDFLLDVRKRNPRTYVILATAMSTRDNMLEALLAGASDYLIKPFSLNDLEMRLYIAEAAIALNKMKFGAVE